MVSGAAASDVYFSTYNGGSFCVYSTPLTKLQTNDHTETDNTADAIADVYTHPVMEVQCSVREYCIPRYVTPGDWIWVYSVDDDMVDTANQVVFQGQTLFPQKVRCVGYTYPIEAGMGVYVYDTTNDVLTDVSDYVAWETGRDTQLELETKPMSILDAAERSVLL